MVEAICDDDMALKARTYKDGEGKCSEDTGVTAVAAVDRGSGGGGGKGGRSYRVISADRWVSSMCPQDIEAVARPLTADAVLGEVTLTQGDNVAVVTCRMCASSRGLPD